ncbi:ABC transporter ATP-binding protein [Microbacterium sp. P03]|uniref:ABC transporter ATP-binding protein n=1 Tax=Microbacterium sp. P03 TaxID=3366946 RepID=UPI003746AAD0
MTGAGLLADITVVRAGGYALRVALQLEPGEIVAVMGPSGAGKSTLLGAIAGQVRLSDGEIILGGAAVASARRHVPPARRGVVLLGQEPRLFPHLTARQNVAFGLRARGITRRDADREADDWLWRVGLLGAGGHRPAELSGGQQQRVAVARALATTPRVLLLDEPLTSLDPETAGDLRAMLQEQLTSTHATAIVVTHDVVDAAAIAHRLIVIEDGAIAQTGDVREVLAAPATRFVAAIVGVNRVPGQVRDGVWHSETGELVLPVPAPAAPQTGPRGGTGSSATGSTVPLGDAAVFRPGAVRLEPVPDATWTGAVRLRAQHPSSPGSWLARVVRLEQTPGGVRVRTTAPDIAVDISIEDAATWRLVPGVPVRLEVAADAVRWPTRSPAAPAATPDATPERTSERAS